jgi:hypothetical protein
VKIKLLYLVITAALLLAGSAALKAQEVVEDVEDIIVPQTVGIYGNTTSLFQAPSSILLPDRREKDIYPFYQYLDLNVASPRHNFFSSTYLRGRNIFEGEEESLDVYNTYIDFSNIKKTFDVRLGRQVISESVNYILLDGGLLRFRPMSGIEFIAYGGYQYKDIQPEPEQPDNDFGIYGFTIKLDQFLGSLISVGYELHDPDDFSSRHFLNLSFNRVVPFTDFADIYTQAEIDIENGNLASLTSGMGITFSKTVYLNLEYTTYEMDEEDDDDNDNEFKLDPIFDLFSDGRLHQGKVGITYLPTSYLDVKASYTFSRYDVLDDETTYGNIAHLGFSWDFWIDHGVRAFNGFYYIDGRDDDYAFGMNVDMTKEVYRGWEMEFAFAYAYYDKITNQDGSAFSYIIGSEYLIMRNLALRTDLEINTNPDFDDDVRVTLGLSYYFAKNI